MKMKLKHIRYAAALLMSGMLLLGACTKENIMGGDPTPPDPEAAGEGYLSFNIDVGDLTATKSTDVGTSAENRVNAVRVILYDDDPDTRGSDPKVKYAFHFNIQTNPSPIGNDYYTGTGVWVNGAFLPGSAVYADDQDNRLGEYRFITFAQRVDRQDYKMLVIINPTYKVGEESSVVYRSPGAVTRDQTETVYDWEKWDDPDYEDNPESRTNLHYLTREGQPLSKMGVFPMTPRKVVDKGSIAFTGNDKSPANFVMTNYQELISVKKETLQEKPELAHQKPVAVTVERIVAKVIVREAAGGITVGPDGAQVSNVTYFIDYVNRYSYWWRRMTWLKDQFQYGAYGQKETLGHSYRAEQYAEDPNFDGFYIEKRYESESQKELRRINFHNSTDYHMESDPEADGLKPLEKTGNNTVNYILENTSTPDYQKIDQDYYTRVVVRATYTPPGMTEHDSYYTFNGRFISEAQLMGEYYIRVGQLAEEGGYIDGQWEQYPFSNILKPFPKFHEEDPPGMPGLFHAIFMLHLSGFEGEGTPGGLWTYESFDSQRAYGLSYFMEGINYYTVPIRHFDFSDSYSPVGVDTYGFYGVVRNNIYAITVNSITGPGHPTPGGFGYISAGINIQPWVRTGQPIDIGDIKPVVTYVTYKYYRGAETEPFKTDYDYDVIAGQLTVQDSETFDRYYGTASVPADQYDHGTLKSAPASSTVHGDPAHNVVEIVYPVLQAAPKVTFNYLSRSDRTPIKAPITRTYPGGAQLTVDNLRADGLFPQSISYAGDVYTFEVYEGVVLPATLFMGTTTEINLLYTKPGGGVEKTPAPTIDPIQEGSSWWIGGTGEPGALLTLSYPDGRSPATTTVYSDRTWAIIGDPLSKDQTVSAKQQLPGLLVSDEVTQTVIPND